MKEQPPSNMLPTGARQVIDEYINVVINLDNADALFDGLGPVLKRMQLLSIDEVMAALREKLEHRHPKARIIAAMMVRELVRVRFSAGAKLDVAEKAEQILLCALKLGDYDARLYSCLAMTIGSLPDDAEGTLLKMLEEPDEILRTCAAGALVNSNTCRSEAVVVLRAALKSQYQAIVALAALGFSRLINRPEYVDEVMAIFSGATEELQAGILTYLKQHEVCSRRVSEPLVAFARDKGNHPQLRGMALSALANVLKEQAIPDLLTALESSEWQVVDGAMDAFMVLGEFPEEAVVPLIKHLCSEDEDLEWIAALGLKAMGENAAPAVPALIQCGLKQSKFPVFQGFIQALGAVGPVATPHLLDLAGQNHPLALDLALFSLMEMGVDGAEPLGEILRRESEADVCRKIAVLLMTMGHKAAPAAPVLAEMLEHSSDTELVTSCATVLSVCGPAVITVMDSLIRCLMNRSRDIAFLAERALWHIGPEAAEALQVALKSAEGEARRRLEHALSGMQAVDESRFERLEQLEPDSLELFVAVGTILVKLNRPATWQEIQERIEKPCADEGREPPFAVGQSSVRTGMKSLSKVLGYELTTHKQGRNGGGVLTPGGLALLPTAQEFLTVKRRRKGVV